MKQMKENVYTLTKVSKISRHIGESMGLDHEMLNKLKWQVGHDIGK